MAEELKEIGKVMGFYSHISVAAIELTGDLAVGDTIVIKGHTTNLEQPIDSMQIEHDKVEKAKKGDQIGIKVKDKVRLHDIVYKK
ncbi:translation elongation factor-like protein [Candidatus Woesearchaeota archaeon]|nr:translation elongation factor-like protein [Candidatus Woesearchaeota archaeon]